MELSDMGVEGESMLNEQTESVKESTESQSDAWQSRELAEWTISLILMSTKEGCASRMMVVVESIGVCWNMLRLNNFLRLQ